MFTFHGFELNNFYFQSLNLKLYRTKNISNVALLKPCVRFRFVPFVRVWNVKLCISFCNLKKGTILKFLSLKWKLFSVIFISVKHFLWWNSTNKSLLKEYWKPVKNDCNVNKIGRHIYTFRMNFIRWLE